MIRLLGVPAIELDGHTVTAFRSNRIPALLGLLASRPGPWQREVVAAALWPDSMPTEGRHNLRQVLLYIKQVMGDSVFVGGRNTIELSPSVCTDLALLLKANDSLQSPSQLIRAAEVAIEVYRGEFLSGYDDEWILPIRSHSAQTYIAALLLVSKHYLESQPSRSLELADVAIQAEPYLERARAAKISALRALGEPASAHREFLAYREMLATELGIEPSSIASDALTCEDTAPESQPVEVPVLVEDDQVRILLNGNRPRQGLDLAIAESQYWVAKGMAQTGLSRLELALAANEKNPTSESYLLGKVVQAELFSITGNSYQSKGILTEFLPRLGRSQTKIRALILYARICSYAYQAEAGTEFAKQGLNLATTIGGIEEQIDAYRAASEIAFQLENAELGEQYSNACIDLARQIGDWQSFAHATSVVAMIRYRTDRVAEAMQAVQTGLNELSEKDSNRASFVRTRFYRVLEEMGETEWAEKGYRTGLDEARRYQDPITLTVTLTYLGDLLTVKGDYAEALAFHTEALRIREGLQENLGIATNLRGIGRVHRATGRYEEAKSALRESARLFLGCDALPGHASALLELAHVYDATGETAMARRIANRARDLLLGMSRHARQTIGPKGDDLAAEADRLAKHLS